MLVKEGKYYNGTPCDDGPTLDQLWVGFQAIFKPNNMPLKMIKLFVIRLQVATSALLALINKTQIYLRR